MAFAVGHLPLWRRAPTLPSLRRCWRAARSRRSRHDRDGLGDNIRVINYQWFGAVHFYTASGLATRPAPSPARLTTSTTAASVSRPRWFAALGLAACRCTWASPAPMASPMTANFITSAVPCLSLQPALPAVGRTGCRGLADAPSRALSPALARQGHNASRCPRPCSPFRHLASQSPTPPSAACADRRRTSCCCLARKDAEGLEAERPGEAPVAYCACVTAAKLKLPSSVWPPAASCRRPPSLRRHHRRPGAQILEQAAGRSRCGPHPRPALGRAARSHHLGGRRRFIGQRRARQSVPPFTSRR